MSLPVQAADFDTDAIRAFFARALGDLEQSDRVHVVTVVAPVAPLEAFLRAAPRDLSFLWHPATGVAIAGSGAAVRIELHGEERLPELLHRTTALWKRIEHQAMPGSDAPPPRVVGGLAFAPGFTDQRAWTGFADGSFTLPRWSYGQLGKNAFLRFAVDAAEERGLAAVGAILAELDELLEALQSAEGTEPTPLPLQKVPQENARQMSPEEWARHIDEIRLAIEGGTLHKVVAARRCDVESEHALDDLQVLEHLAWYPQCYRFAFRRGDATFLGASPERLFAKHGLELDTEALAGTMRSLGSDIPRLTFQADALLNSGKNLSEHAFVVDEIRQALLPLVDDLRIHKRPEIRKLRNLLHLHTLMSATLRPATHVVHLLEALHPTPAVGGAPRRAAVDWIVEHEPAPRGWYSGPVGWLDMAGDGAFAVAIRCGVVRAHEAALFTGAGVVADSDAESEYEETSLKQRAMFRCIGLDSQ